ncbi:hypothetical protein BGZ61DRAFT_540179 [Ilyonectria robusta]|uniref:uncharacterized protein n=1 Tax=Ilyonectria robusta TaxID=1079257 RepID=UPI001E8E9646|nr:uncharacterized protein BGZ61DRAFT_540179 [Ilyonectria robusta]KAH8659621.1 hypothetical protein BGZ61DRAFT_540179 [Ilyonectria robusta]
MIDADIPATPSRPDDVEDFFQFRELDAHGPRRGRENGGRHLPGFDDDDNDNDNDNGNYNHNNNPVLIPDDRPIVLIKTGGLNLGDGRAVQHFLKTRLQACDESTVTTLCEVCEVDTTKSGDGDTAAIDGLVRALFTSGQERTQEFAAAARKALPNLFDERGVKKKVKDGTFVTEILGVATRRASPHHGKLNDTSRLFVTLFPEEITKGLMFDLDESEF